MASVRFAWSPALVELRRRVCPKARWQKSRREWLMSDNEARTFLEEVETMLEYQRWQTQIWVDDVVWVVGFVQGAPYRISSSKAA